MEPIHFPLDISAIVIDLDGTMLHTAPELTEAANRMLRDMDYTPAPQELMMSYIGNGISWLVKRALTGDMHATPDAALFEHAMPIFEKHYTELLLNSKPFGGVIEGLDAMQAAGFRLGCITNKLARYTEPLLKGTGLAKYFEIVLSGDTLAEKKPHPMPLLHAAEFFGIPVEKAAADRRFAQRHRCRARGRMSGVLRALRLQSRRTGRQPVSGCGDCRPVRRAAADPARLTMKPHNFRYPQETATWRWC